MGRVLLVGVLGFCFVFALIVWPMFSRLSEPARRYAETKEKYGDDAVRLLECASKTPRDREAVVCLGLLGRLGRKALPVAPRLARLVFSETSVGERRYDPNAVDALDQVAGFPPAAPGGPHPSPEERLARSTALLGADTIVALAAGLDAPVEAERWRSLYALEFVGEPGAGAAPKVVALLSHPEGAFRGQAARTLGAMGRAAFESGGCALPDMRFDADEKAKKGLADGLSAAKIPFADWQAIISRCPDPTRR